MRNTFLGALGLAVLSVGLTVQAHADTVFTLNQSTAFGNANFGTVALQQNGANNVLVTVALSPNYYFIQYGLAFGFQLSGVSNPTTSSPAFGYFQNAGPGSYSTPYGTFNYGVNSDAPPSALCPRGAFNYDGSCGTLDSQVNFSNAGQTLSFDLTAAGLTPSSFVTNGNVYFFANLLNANDSAGAVAAGAPSSVTPEPSSLFLSGTGLLGVAGFLRRRATAILNRG